MTNDEATPAASAPATAPSNKWTEAEKLALCVSIIRAHGISPKWSEVAIPAGRTRQATQKMYPELLKSTAGVIMTNGDSIKPSKKRGPNAASTGALKKKKVKGAATLSEGEQDYSGGSGGERKVKTKKRRETKNGKKMDAKKCPVDNMQTESQAGEQNSESHHENEAEDDTNEIKQEDSHEI